MKKLIYLFFIIATVAAFVWFFRDDPGFIVIGWGAWSVETSLSLFILVLVVDVIIIYILARFLRALWYLPRRLFYNQQKAEQSLVYGVLALIQGQWQKAEQSFLKTLSLGELSALHYLGAAYAAHQLHEPSRAKDYFAKARHSCPQETVALTLFEAKLQKSQNDLPAALEKALDAQQIDPKKDDVLLLLLTLYVQLADWTALLKVLPSARKRKVLSTEQLQGLEDRAHIALILNTIRVNPSQASKVWSRIPKVTRLRPVILKVYVEHLIMVGDAAEAEPLLREGLKYHWDAELLALYGTLETSNTSQQISYAENWLKSHEQDPVLLQTLGQLCLRNRLWDKARQYLDNSLRLNSQPKTYQLLAELSEQQRDFAQANHYYRQGIQLSMNSQS
jgi:HemY protein